MVYCTWALPQQIFNMSTSNDMNACSIVLYVITERWPGAKKYRDMYEDIKRNVLESIEENQYQPRHALKRLNSSIFKSMQRTEEGRADVDQLMTDMVGEALPLTRDGGNPDSQLDHLSRNTSMWPGMTDVPDGSSLLSSMPAVSSQQQQRPGPNIDNSLAMVPDLDLFNAFDQQVLEAGEFDFGLSAPGYQF